MKIKWSFISKFIKYFKYVLLAVYLIAFPFIFLGIKSYVSPWLKSGVFILYIWIVAVILKKLFEYINSPAFSFLQTIRKYEANMKQLETIKKEFPEYEPLLSSVVQVLESTFVQPKIKFSEKDRCIEFVYRNFGNIIKIRFMLDKIAYFIKIDGEKFEFSTLKLNTIEYVKYVEAVVMQNPELFKTAYRIFRTESVGYNPQKNV